jgi:hypothetical protein
VGVFGARGGGFWYLALVPRADAIDTSRYPALYFTPHDYGAPGHGALPLEPGGDPRLLELGVALSRFFSDGVGIGYLMKVVALKCRFLTSFTSVAVPVLRLSAKLRHPDHHRPALGRARVVPRRVAGRPQVGQLLRAGCARSAGQFAEAARDGGLFDVFGDDDSDDDNRRRLSLIARCDPLFVCAGVCCPFGAFYFL